MALVGVVFVVQERLQRVGSGACGPGLVGTVGVVGLAVGIRHFTGLPSSSGRGRLWRWRKT
jgi:hypothetical protein